MKTLTNHEKDKSYQKPAIETVQIELEEQILTLSEIPIEDDGDLWP